MASKAPDDSQVTSRVKRFSRYTQNETIDQETYFMPFIEELVAGLARRGTLVVVMDGSEVGRHCLALVVSLVYKGRALPLTWTVVKGSKGHFPETAHVELLAQIKAIIPPETDVIFLGDGEFDGLSLLAKIEAATWHYVCRTAHNRWVCEQETWLQLDELGLQPVTISVYRRLTLLNRLMVPSWSWSGGILITKTHSISSLTSSWVKKPSIGIATVSELKPFSPTRKARAFICTKVTLLTRNA